ncbi:hypothetical protein BH10BAC5_BH10BAC5_07230 [soil metagenome]
MQKPSLLVFTFMFSICFLFSSQAAFSQASKISTGISLSEVLSAPVPDPQVSEVVKNINIARNRSDLTSQRYWENKLNELTHPQIITQSADNFIYKTINSEVSDPEKVLNMTKLTGGVIVANSVSRERVTGEIYAALAFFGSGNADTLKVYRSVDNGLHFTLLSTATAPGFSITNNSLDVEAVSKGDSTYAFLSLSYIISGVYYSTIYRVRQDGLQVNTVIFSGIANRYINARVTSDNARFTNNTYIYFSFVLDSVVAGARNLRSKLGILKSPFSNAMDMTMGYQSAALGSYSYAVGGTAPDSATFETDIAYLDNAGDSSQVYTVTVVRGVPGVFGDGTWLAYSRSNDFGATAPTLITFTTDNKLKEKPRLATTGYLNNSLMTVTRRLFGGNDWDAYYFYSSNSNAPAPTFTGNYVDSSTDTTFGVSVAGIQRGNGTYLFAYNNLKGANNSTINIRGFNNNFLGTIVQSNPSNIQGTNRYGTPDAGFRNVNNDSCFVIWGGSVGIGSYVTGGCTGTFVGIGNNTTELRDFRLEQNYPNPFNPTTNISYNIPTSGLVKIVVYDVLGSEVATVLNESKVAGYYSANFDGKNLASGAYYYKITFTSDNNSFSQTKKMMLIK